MNKKWFKIILTVFTLTLVGFIFIIGLAYKKQDQLIQEAISSLNQDFEGRFVIADSHISPFANFPYVSIDLENLEIYEKKADTAERLAYITDFYMGFDLLSIIEGDFQIKKLKLSDGFIKLIQHEDGTFNIAQALGSDNETTTSENDTDAMALTLSSIELERIDLLKINEASDVVAELFIEEIQSSISTSEEHIKAELESNMLFNLILAGDTSFLHHKHLSLSTAIDYDLQKGLLQLSPSTLQLEQAEFRMEGAVDVANDLNLDLKFSGQKPNFDLFLAFVPEEYSPLIRRYQNGGTVYFNADISGSAAFGQIPHVEVEFGCEEAFFENIEVAKEVDELFFKGFFTTGEANTLETMSLQISDFTARPETGSFTGDIAITNFEAPDIDIQLNSSFNLEFLTEFFDIEAIEDANGEVSLAMNFHDIIDLDDPAKTIESFNESYFTELNIKNLNFSTKDFPLPLEDINIHAAMDGHQAIIDQFSFKAGASDLSLTASISDLPAIIHHTGIPVDVKMDIRSSMIDIAELTQTATDSVGFNEQIKDLSIGFRFNSSAKAFTESPNLPLGEFFIDSLNAQLTNYPHKLHDFHADIIIDSTDFNVIDFTGMLDQSDFHFNGRLENYDLWFEENPKGKTVIDFDLNSDQLELADVFSYNGQNYVPEDYRDENIKDIKIHAVSELFFEDALRSLALKIDNIQGYAVNHDMQLSNFNGQVYYDTTQLKIEGLGGQLGNSDLRADLTYQLDSLSEKAHELKLSSRKLDFDQLFSWAPPADTATVEHEDGFNLFDLPFADLNFDLSIADLNYHRYLIKDFDLKGRMQKDHFIYVDTMALKAAGGEMKLKGYFNGSDPDNIYFSPDMSVKDIDLDKLLFKFDNFGQDQLISDNLHGRLTGTVKGKIHMHPDLIPATDISALDMDIEVVDGSLVNFTAFEALSNYFTDKNLNNVRFDTLKNQLRLENGDLIIPNMNINTSLGYFEIAGRQGIDLTMDYTMRVPVKVVTRAGMQRIFTRRQEIDQDQIDEIEYRDMTRNTRFITINISGTPDDYEIDLGKKNEK